MPVYKLRAKRKYGDLPEGYELQVSSSSTSAPSSSETRDVIKNLGFNSSAQSYASSGNWEIEKQ